ncbi:MAG: hypothetical protein IKK39_16000 [Thermoguttaceae bacterium]|nr:hypothetical protein [Thermoguttaceae bacterium]
MTFFLFLSSCAARYVSTRNGGFGRFERRVDGYYFRTRRENQDVRRLDGALFAKFRRAAPDFAARTPISPPAERPPMFTSSTQAHRSSFAALDSHGRFKFEPRRVFLLSPTFDAASADAFSTLRNVLSSNASD